MPSRSLSLSARSIDAARLTYLRFGRVGDRVVVSTDAGSLLVVDDAEFQQLLNDGAASHLNGELTRDGFDIDVYARHLRRRASYLGQGPTHHRLVLGGLVSGPYAPQGSELAPMTLDGVKAALDHALQTTAGQVTLTLVASDAARHIEAIRFAFEYAVEKNKYESKVLHFELETIGAGIEPTLWAELAERDVLVRLRVDGPAAVHDKLHGAGAYTSLASSLTAETLPRLEVETWVTPSLADAADAVAGLLDGLEELGVERFRLMPSLPGLTPAAHHVAPARFVAVRAAVVDALIARDNKLRELGGVELAGRLFAKLPPRRPGARSPAGDGTGRLTYAPNGDLFPTDDALRLALVGDATFALTHLPGVSLDETLAHPTLRALEVASLKDSLPGCWECWNRPFCGTSAVTTFLSSQDLFLTRLSDPQCRASLSLAEHLVSRHTEGGQAAAALNTWAGEAKQASQP